MILEHVPFRWPVVVDGWVRDYVQMCLGEDSQTRKLQRLGIVVVDKLGEYAKAVVVLEQDQLGLGPVRRRLVLWIGHVSMSSSITR
jgi:hypothetical protein